MLTRERRTTSLLVLAWADVTSNRSTSRSGSASGSAYSGRGSSFHEQSSETSTYLGEQEEVQDSGSAN